MKHQFMIANMTVLAAYLALATSMATGLRLRTIILLLLALWMIASVLLSRPPLYGVVDRRRTLALAAVCMFTLLTFLTADLAYGLYYNVSVRAPGETARTFDPQLTAPELASALPLCERDGTPFYKPGVRAQGTITGNLFVPPAPGSTASWSETAEPRRVTYAINQLGLRESSPPEECDIIALGDSFTFGQGVDTSDTWVVQLSGLIDRGVLNTGFSGSGPVDEVNRLKWLLAKTPVRPRFVIWLLFEGNDLTDDRFMLTPPRVSSLFEQTLAGVLMNGMETIKRRSVLARAWQGDLIFQSVRNAPKAEERLKTGALVYNCGSLGKKLFYPGDIEAALMSRDAVKRHPGYQRLKDSFANMKSLMESSQMKVLVALAPTDARVLAAHCPALADVSPDSPLEKEVKSLANQHGMRFVPLIRAFQSAVSSDMLYFPDDTHWNPTGHRVAAKAFAAALSQALTDTRAPE